MPVAGQRPVRVVVLKEVSPLGQCIATKLEEVSAGRRIPRFLQSGGHEGPIATPYIRVCITTEAYDVRVVRRDDRAAIVDLCPQYEKASIEDVRDGLR